MRFGLTAVSAAAALLGCSGAIIAPVSKAGSSIPESFWQNLGHRPASKLSASTLNKRATADIETLCRDATTADLAGLSDSQLQTLMSNANGMFEVPVTTYTTPRRYRADMFGSGSYGGWNGKLSILRDSDVVAFGQDRAKVCLDGLGAKATTDRGTCTSSTLKTYGTLDSSGSSVTVSVLQGWVLEGKVTTSSSSGTTFEKSTTDSSLNSNNHIFINSDEVGGEATVGFEIFGAESSVTINYKHIFQYGDETTTETSHEINTVTGEASEYSSSTEKTETQDYQQSVAVTVNPPAGSTCYIGVKITNCKGTTRVDTPITFPSGSVVIDFAESTCLKGDPNTCNTKFYVPISQLLFGFTPSVLTDNIGFAVKSAGQYSEHCDPKTPTTGQGSANGVSSSYKPTLSCPPNLGVKAGCSVNMEDYFGRGMISGDSSVWAANGVSYSQSPGPGSEVSFGQQTITFNASTPYQSTVCTSLLQVVPPFGATFVPELSELMYPQDGGPVIGARYTVGYISQCATSQFGACRVTNVRSRFVEEFDWVQTSATGSPAVQLKFTSASGVWPEVDTLTFTIACEDVYGSSSGSEYQQQVYRGDVETTTLTANVQTQTVNSAEKYLFTSVRTLYTSMVTPVTTHTLQTSTLYSLTSYTGTLTLTNFGAVGTRTTVRSTSTRTQTASGLRVTTRVSPTPATVSSVLTRARTAVVISTLTLPRPTRTILTTPTVTSTSVIFATVLGSAAPTACPPIVPRDVMEPRRIVSTRTITDSQGTRTVTDYINTQTRTLGTTVSTNKDDFAVQTLSTLKTEYDTGFRFITTIKYEQSTTIQDRFTRTSVIVIPATVTSTPPALRTTILLPQVTVLSTLLTGNRPVSTVTSQAPGSTVTTRTPGSITRTLLTFSTSTTTVARPCTR